MSQHIKKPPMILQQDGSLLIINYWVKDKYEELVISSSIMHTDLNDFEVFLAHNLKGYKLGNWSAIELQCLANKIYNFAVPIKNKGLLNFFYSLT